MYSIIVNNKSYSYDAIKHSGASLLSIDEAEYTFTFTLAQQWLNNQHQFVFHTSGSTGIPKEILLQRTQLEASAECTLKTLSLSANEHILLCIPTEFIGGAMMLIRGLILGATITVQNPNGNPLEKINTSHPYTFASFAPMQLFPVLQNTQHEITKLAQFKTVLVGGAAIDTLLETVLSKVNTHIYHTYGMTETVSHIALKQLGVDTSFKAMEGVLLKQNHVGCLCIKSESTMQKWIETNDVVELLDANHFKVLGRADEVINSGGIKIWPAKIEKIAKEIIGTQSTNLFAVGIADTKLGQQLILVIESALNANLIELKLKAELPLQLNKYEIPKQYYVISTFIYTQTGKINKPETLKMIALQ